MSRPTTDHRSAAERDAGPSTLRIDDDVFESLSVETGRRTDGGSPRIVRWFATWAGDRR